MKVESLGAVIERVARAVAEKQLADPGLHEGCAPAGRCLAIDCGGQIGESDVDWCMDQLPREIVEDDDERGTANDMLVAAHERVWPTLVRPCR